jgi:hypothetical protein
MQSYAATVGAELGGELLFVKGRLCCYVTPEVAQVMRERFLTGLTLGKKRGRPRAHGGNQCQAPTHPSPATNPAPAAADPSPAPSAKAPNATQLADSAPETAATKPKPPSPSPTRSAFNAENRSNETRVTADGSTPNAAIAP